MERLSTNYSQIKDMTVLSAEDLLDIEIMAKTLQLEDCLTALLLKTSDLTERELEIATRVHGRGRQMGVKEAGESLFGQMRYRTGTQACLEYLKQMSSTFVIEVTSSGANTSGFSFNVYPPGTRPVSVEGESAEVIPIK